MSTAEFSDDMVRAVFALSFLPGEINPQKLPKTPRNFRIFQPKNKPQ